jgi:hypothetical protein
MRKSSGFGGAGSEQLSHLFEMASRKPEETWNSATALPDLTSISAGANEVNT